MGCRVLNHDVRDQPLLSLHLPYLRQQTIACQSNIQETMAKKPWLGSQAHHVLTSRHMLQGIR